MDFQLPVNCLQSICALIFKVTMDLKMKTLELLLVTIEVDKCLLKQGVMSN